MLAHIDMVHVPYRGGGPALVGLLGGEVQVFSSALTQMLPYIRDGRLRGLAVTSATRNPLAPEIPTMVESGFDQFVTASVNFLVAPPGTPMPVRQRLSEAVASALASAELKDAFAKIGAKAEPATPERVVFLHCAARAALVAHRAGDGDFGRLTCSWCRSVMLQPHAA